MKATAGIGRRDPQARAHPLAPSEHKRFGWQVLILLLAWLMLWLLSLAIHVFPGLGHLSADDLAFWLGTICLVVAMMSNTLNNRIGALEKLLAELEARQAGESPRP